MFVNRLKGTRLRRDDMVFMLSVGSGSPEKNVSPNLVKGLVGDRWRDIAAGQRAGCTTILVDGGHTKPTMVESDVRMQDVRQAADWILQQPM